MRSIGGKEKHTIKTSLARFADIENVISEFLLRNSHGMAYQGCICRGDRVTRHASMIRKQKVIVKEYKSK